MLSEDFLFDDACEFLKAFPSANERRLTGAVWQTIENYDWGFNLIARLQGKEMRDDAVWYFAWVGPDFLLLWGIAWVFLGIPALIRNSLVQPTYDKRVRRVVKQCRVS
jgi:hypothetical protein